MSLGIIWLNGLGPDVEIPNKIRAIIVLNSGMTEEEVAEKNLKGEFHFHVKEFQVLLANDYLYTIY